jgi:glucosamine-6-phosphate deaminase
MQVRVFPDRESMSRAAADAAAARIREAIAEHGDARIVAATGGSQLDFLRHLCAATNVAWARVELFHLDEYIGVPASHPASFRRMLREHLIDKTGIVNYHMVDADQDSETVRAKVGAEITRRDIDVAFIGIGENGHLAFNDPPADFTTTEPYLEVTLDDACRRQQVGEGWFRILDDVPRRAISMSIQQILKARQILVIVPDARKAAAVKAALEGKVTPLVPASILQTHPAVTLYLDEPAASALSAEASVRYQL